MSRDRQAKETNAHNDPPPIPLSCLHAQRAQTSIPGTRRSRVPLMQKYGNRRGGACQNVAYCHNWIVFSGERLCSDGPRCCSSSRDRCLLIGQRADPQHQATSLFANDLTPVASSRPESATVGARRHPNKLMKDAAHVRMARKAAIERDVNEGHRGVFQQFPRAFQLQVEQVMVRAVPRRCPKHTDEMDAAIAALVRESLQACLTDKSKGCSRRCP